MDHVELQSLPKASHRSFTHDGQDPWALGDLDDSYRYLDDPDDEHLVSRPISGASKSVKSPMNPNLALGHARTPSKQSFLPLDGGSLLEKEVEEVKGPWWQRLRGWRFGAANCTAAVIAVFIINLGLSLWVATAKGYENGRGVLFEGDCNAVRKANVELHLGINALSTILLSSSNYCMQCYSAPTRKELDRAHAKGRWLEVGVMSFSNIFHIHWTRAVLWCCLALSSLPLHLFFNSVAYASISANNYAVVEVNEAFINTPNASNITMFNNTQVRGDTGFSDLVHQLYGSNPGSNSTGFKRLENADCIKAYAQDFISDYSNLLLVIDNQNASSPPTTNNTFNQVINDKTMAGSGTNCQPDPYKWICKNPTCKKACPSLWQNELNNPAAWSPFGNTAKYCVAQITAPKCKLEFSETIIIVVMVFNVIKAAIMMYLVRMKDTPLVTVGDAISSYISNPDPITKYICLYGKKDLRNGPNPRPIARQYHPTKQFRIAATTRGRVIIFSITFTIALAVSLFLLVFGISNVKGDPDLNTIWGMGIGAVDVRAMISWGIPATDLVANVLIANLAQPILSIIYFAYNSIWTTMALAREWNRYGFRRHGLRVSGRPRAAQRMTYFLQLPYRYALPVMALSGVLHWLVSQSIFLVAINRYDRDGTPVHSSYYTYGSSSYAKSPLQGEYLTCGYSPVAILAVCLVGMVLVLSLIAQGARRFAPGIPLAGTCSGAIAAACHLPATEDAAKAPYRPLAWGVTGHNGEMGHCAFSSNIVEEPSVNALYMGEMVDKKSI